MNNILDMGCGIGRHSILLAKNGFNTYAMDLSEDAVRRAQQWAEMENLNIDFKTADMTNLPYDKETMDAIFAYYVISHADTKGVVQILNELKEELMEKIKNSNLKQYEYPIDVVFVSELPRIYGSDKIDYHSLEDWAINGLPKQLKLN